MKVLVVGGGAREHALCWALRRSRRLTELYCAPGNAGTDRLAKNVSIAAESVAELADWAVDNGMDLTVVGPEAPLAAGLVDTLGERGLAAFGPSARAAEIEASKCWSADFMQRHGIPAPRARECRSVVDGLNALAEIGIPAAIKADGLAAGKGVMLVESQEDARRALEWMLEQQGLGAAGRRVLIQELLEGPELSVLAFADGRDVAPMPAARDYKRLGEGDGGPNTGGMGAYCDPSLSPAGLLTQVRADILEPAVRGMAAEGRPFQGVLYAGLMLTCDGPKVLEFNCRFGDPETQVILPLLETDLIDVLEAVIERRLSSVDLAWRGGSTCGVVLASEGYPGGYPTGREIDGLQRLRPDELVFQAGTARQPENGRVVTSGGRVLTVVGLGDDLSSARQAAYALAEGITFEGCYYRRDIAASLITQHSSLITRR